MASTRILEASGLTKVYRRGAAEVRAVEGIDLAVEAREFLSIMGRSGSGKTTLLDLLGCLLRPTDGRLAIDGNDVVGASDAELARIRRERIGFVFQEFNLIPTLNAIENVMLPLRYGRRRPDGSRRAVARRRRARSVGARRSSSSSSASGRARPTDRPSSPAASNSASRSRGPSSTSRRSCWPTSRPASSIRRRPSA
jgi:ABC-type lipoprotein export system ATPase subunit